jgi:hypothetical protein
MDGRRQRVTTWLEHLREHAWLYRLALAVGLWITMLYMAGPHLGVLFICASALTLFFCAHRLGGRTRGSAGGWSFLNRHGQQAAGEMSSRELDAHVRGLPPPSAGISTSSSSSSSSGGGGGVGASGWVAEGGSSSSSGGGGKTLGGGAVPTKNALLAELAEQRLRRRAAAAAEAAPPLAPSG